MDTIGAVGAVGAGGFLDDSAVVWVPSESVACDQDGASTDIQRIRLGIFSTVFFLGWQVWA
jgi:hypothetical protein